LNIFFNTRQKLSYLNLSENQFVFNHKYLKGVLGSEIEENPLNLFFVAC